MEHPVMYHALGTEPRTQHPYHVYEDIRSEPTAVKATLDVIQPAVDKVAEEFIKRDKQICLLNPGIPQHVPRVHFRAEVQWSFTMKVRFCINLSLLALLALCGCGGGSSEMDMKQAQQAMDQATSFTPKICPYFLEASLMSKPAAPDSG
jgi:hypothetical protein